MNLANDTYQHQSAVKNQSRHAERRQMEIQLKSFSKSLLVIPLLIISMLLIGQLGYTSLDWLNRSREPSGISENPDLMAFLFVQTAKGGELENFPVSSSQSALESIAQSNLLLPNSPIEEPSGPRIVLLPETDMTSQPTAPLSVSTATAVPAFQTATEDLSQPTDLPVATTQPTHTAINTQAPKPSNTPIPIPPTAPPPPSPDEPWYNPLWPWRKQITIEASMVVENLNNFPVLIYIQGDRDIGLFAQSDGDDLLFTSADGVTKLAHEIETYSASKKLLVAWVNVPQLSATGDTQIYLYFGNPIAGNQENNSALWSSYEAVYHLQNDTLDAAGKHHATDHRTDRTTGKIGMGRESGSDASDHLDLGDWSATSGTSQFTGQAWVKIDQLNNSDGRIFAKATDSGDEDHVWMLSVYNYPGQGDHHFRFRIKTGTSNSNGTTVVVGQENIHTNTWYLVSTVYTGSEMKIYINGKLDASTSKSGNIRVNSWSNWTHNNPEGHDRGLDGTLDEIRFSFTARSEGWLRTEFNNQSNPAGFIDLGDLEMIPMPGT
jgi:hypothetical protein